MVNLRGVRWNYEVKNVPNSTQQSRMGFVFWQLLDFARFLFTTDLLLQLGIRLFMTSPPSGVVGDLDSKFVTLRHEQWAWSFAKALLFGCGPYFLINLQYTFCAIVAVLLGLGKPEDWPPFFRRLCDVTTVRGFWGKFWHRYIRKVGSISIGQRSLARL
jgi:hypothetical protein